jgi:FixJ family two-component response regulator
VLSVSDRERQVFQPVVEGKSTKQIAGILGSATETTYRERRKISRELELDSPLEWVRYGIRNQIMEA